MSRANQPRDSSWVFPAPIEWCYLSVGALLMVRYRWIMDDAMVYLRYLDNLLFLKLGLVFNAGEYVEGFSSLGWVVLLIPLRAIGLSFETIVLGVGIVVFACFGYGLVVLNRKLAPEGAPVVNLPLALLLGNYACLSFFTGGLEVVLVQLLAVVFALFFIEPQSRLWQVGVALAPVVRHELVVPLLLALVFVRAQRRIALRIGILAVAALGLLVAFRVVYYAELVPNTFFVKDDVEIRRGLTYLWETVSTYGTAWVAAAGVIATWWLLRRRALTFAPARLWMLAAAASVAAYVVKVGGAPLHYWYLAFPFCLSLATTAGLAEGLLAREFRGRRIVAWTAGLALFAATILAYPIRLERHPLSADLGLRNGKGFSDPEWHRKLFRRDSYGIDAKPDYSATMPDGEYRGVSMHGLCALMFERIDYRWVHGFGLTDPILARVDVEEHRAGHKRRLFLLANDLRELRESPEYRRIGGLGQAVEDGVAPPWVEHEIEKISVIERKLYNRHRPWENLKLALAGDLTLSLDGETRERVENYVQGVEDRRLERRRAAREERRKKRREAQRARASGTAEPTEEPPP